MEDKFLSGASMNVARAAKKSNFFNDGDVKSRSDSGPDEVDEVASWSS